MKTVFLWSYIRPELTARTISKILEWGELGSLIVIIDGLRESADKNEAFWRKSTIETVENFALIDSRIDLWIYDKNVGNTNHILRVQLRALAVEEYGIWLEEDIDIDLDAYLILQNMRKNDSDPFLLTGYSHADHGQLNSIKNTLFVPLWGQTINSSLYYLVEKIWNDKVFDKKIVINAINNVFEVESKIESNYYKQIVEYWTKYSEWGILSSKRWDALANYSLWSAGFFANSATERIANDVSFLDFRGMNQRSQPKLPKMHEPNFIENIDFRFCKNCERIASRIEKSQFRRAIVSARYRIAHAGTELTNHATQWYSD